MFGIQHRSSKVRNILPNNVSKLKLKVDSHPGLSGLNFGGGHIHIHPPVPSSQFPKPEYKILPTLEHTCMLKDLNSYTHVRRLHAGRVTVLMLNVGFLMYALPGHTWAWPV